MSERDGCERVLTGAASMDCDGAAPAGVGRGRAPRTGRIVGAGGFSVRFGMPAQDGSGRWPSFTDFAAARDGVVAIEVGLLATPFFMLLVGIMTLGLISWLHSTLDYATQKAARKIMTGSLQAANTTASQFRSSTLCGYLPGVVFDCNKLVVNLAVVSESAAPTGWYNYVNAQKTALKAPDMDNSKNSFCFGGGNTFQVLQVSYPLPIFSKYLATAGALASGYSLITSSAAFKNEPFQGGGGNGDNC